MDTYAFLRFERAHFRTKEQRRDTPTIQNDDLASKIPEPQIRDVEYRLLRVYPGTNRPVVMVGEVLDDMQAMGLIR